VEDKLVEAKPQPRANSRALSRLQVKEPKRKKRSRDRFDEETTKVRKTYMDTLLVAENNQE